MPGLLLFKIHRYLAQTSNFFVSSFSLFIFLQSTCAYSNTFEVFSSALKRIVPFNSDLDLYLALSSLERASGWFLVVDKANGFSTAFIGTSVDLLLKVLLHLCAKLFTLCGLFGRDKSAYLNP